MTQLDHQNPTPESWPYLRLRKEGFRISEARRVLIDYLWSQKEALDPRQICEGLARAGEPVDRVSVYRNLELLLELGIVHRLSQGSYILCQQASCSSHRHLFLVCQNCSHTSEIHLPKDILSELQNTLSQQGFHSGQTQIQIDGQCRRCQEGAEKALPRY